MRRQTDTPIERPLIPSRLWCGWRGHRPEKTVDEVDAVLCRCEKRMYTNVTLLRERRVR